MKYLVLGAGGFIGGELYKALQDPYSEVYGVSRKPSDDPNMLQADLIYPDLLKWVLDKTEPDAVYHLANVQNSDPNCLSINNTVNRYVSELVPKSTKLIFASSSTVYGDLGLKKVCKETDPCVPTSDYGKSKLIGESLLQDSVKLRFCAVVGKGNKKGAIYDIVNKVKLGGEIELFGENLGSIKPYLHIHDAVNALLDSIYLKNEVYNVCPQSVVSINAIALLVMRELRVSLPIKWIDNPIIGDNKMVQMSEKKLVSSGFFFGYGTSYRAVESAIKELL